MLLPELSPLPENLNDALESLNRYEKLCKIRPPEHNITSEFLDELFTRGEVRLQWIKHVERGRYRLQYIPPIDYSNDPRIIRDQSKA